MLRTQLISALNLSALFLYGNGVWYFQAQKLLLRDGTLANFTIQSPSTLPTITLGLPANARVNTEIQQKSIIMTNLCFNNDVKDNYVVKQVLLLKLFKDIFAKMQWLYSVKFNLKKPT